MSQFLVEYLALEPFHKSVEGADILVREMPDEEEDEDEEEDDKRREEDEDDDDSEDGDGYSE